MSLPFFALVTPLIFAQGEKGGFNIRLYLAFPLSLHFILSQGEKGGVF